MSIILLVRPCPFKKPIASTEELSDRAVITSFKEIIRNIKGKTFKHRQKDWKSTGSI